MTKNAYRECARIQITDDAIEISAIVRSMLQELRLSREARARLTHVMINSERIVRNAEAFRETPLCAESMGCLCAGHAAGASAATPCDAREVRR